MGELRELLLVAAGLLLINAALGAVMWARQRTPLHRALFLVWTLHIVSMLVQGLVQAERWMVFAFGAPTLAINVMMVDLYRRALDLSAHWRVYVVAALAGFVGSAFATRCEAPFWAASLPLVLGVTVPLADLCLQSVTSHRKTLSTMGRLAVVAIALDAFHLLDYPFLRNDPRFAAVGFMVAILAGLAMSITAPAIILERTATEVKRLQSEVVASERLAAIGEAAAVVAHEIRNPLAVIANTTRILERKSSLSEEGRELLSIQRSETVRLDRLVHDLLVVARPMTLRETDLNVADVLRHAVALSMPLAEASDVRVTTMIPRPLESAVRGDPDHILLAISNLLRNAIEASPKGGEVRASVDVSRGQLRVWIDDEGTGIDLERLPRLFDPFFTTRAKGSGLGLAIVNRVMKAHGGSVRAENLPSHGARFELAFGERPPA